MLDKDLAELYGVSTGNLNKAVKRNIDRFPPDFMFQLTRFLRGGKTFQEYIKQKIEIKIDEIEGLYEGTSNAITLTSGEDKEIPIHRIKEIRRKEELIWKR